MSNSMECPICKSIASAYTYNQRDVIFFTCPICGRFEYGEDDYGGFNENQLSSYLFYNSFKRVFRGSELRYHTSLSKEKCDEYKKEYEQGDRSHGLPVHMDSEMVSAWYPKTFADRVDDILLYISSNTDHMGEQISLSYQGMLSLLFIDRKEIDSFTSKNEWRSKEKCTNEAKYMLDYLSKSDLITYGFGSTDDKALYLTLSPKGYARVDEIQKATSYGRSALVAMKFGEDTRSLREAIRKGIADAGYLAVFIDEVQHNDFITPELLKHIRDSKFVVVDLTHQNNGAYFEEGYAMGLGKPVIQLCQKDTKLHFDIAQKNTIMWETTEDIPLRLMNRIKATID